jgi:hypothetical protein
LKTWIGHRVRAARGRTGLAGHAGVRVVINRHGEVEDLDMPEQYDEFGG